MVYIVMVDKKIEKRNSKWDLIWIIPELVGIIIIIIAGLFHMKHIPSYKIIGLMEWTFQIVLAMVVVMVGIKGINPACKELKKVE